MFDKNTCIMIVSVESQDYDGYVVIGSVLDGGF